MAATAPPRPPESTESIDRRELEALVEALIEEARRRARRRRLRYGASILLVALAAAGSYFGFHNGGGATGSVAAQADPAGGGGVAAGTATGAWQPSRGPYGGLVYVVAAAPSAPDTVYAGTARGVFVSRNGGASWHSAGLAVARGALQVVEPRITSLAIDPRDVSRVYATRFLSTDGGFTFHEELFRTTNGGRSWRSLDLDAQLVAVSPADPATVYAVVAAGRRKNRLLKSTDAGRTWQPTGGRRASTFFSLALDPSSAATVYAATGNGILKSTDSGKRWQRVWRRGASAVAIDPRDTRTLYAGTSDGVIKSGDGGQSWRVMNTVLGGHGRDRGFGDVLAFVVDPLDSETVYAAVRCQGIFKSGNGGVSWRAVNAGRDPECLDPSIAISARSPHALFGVYPGRGVFKSTDGALTWRAANTGLSVTTASSLAVEPSASTTIYAGTPIGLFKSSDGGRGWSRVAPGVVGAVVIGPRNPKVVLAAEAAHKIIRSTDAGRTWRSAGAGIRPRPAALAISGDNAYALTFGRGIYTSGDGGQTWTAPIDPITTYGRALAAAPGDPDVVYVSVGGVKTAGLYRSTDAGRSWVRVDGTPEDTDISAIAIDPTSAATIYIGTGGEGAFKSTDAGASWERATSGLPQIVLKGISVSGKHESFPGTVGINAIVIDPAHPATLYAATSGRGIFRSTDAGTSWHPLNNGLAVLHVVSLALDKTGRTLYAGAVNSGVVALRLGGR